MINQKIQLHINMFLFSVLVLTFRLPLAAASVDVTSLDVRGIQEIYKKNQFSTEYVIQSFLTHIETYEPSYNAFISINPQALEDARIIDQRRAAGEALSALAGIPIIVKESIDVAGLPSTAGWAKWSKDAGGIALVPEFDAPVVARLREAGAIILGKGNIPALSASGTHADSSWAGPTYNAVDRTFVPGASSTGVATAVSAGFVVLGLGEETGGSIQNPAAAQALVSIKPTFALLPNTGIVPLCGSTRDVAGALTKTVYDAAIMLDVTAGYTILDPKTVAAIGHIPEKGFSAGLKTTALRGKRIGLYGPGWSGRKLTSETQSLYNQAVAELKSRGATVVEDPFAATEFASRFTPTRLYHGGDCVKSLAYDLDQYLLRLGSSSRRHSLAELRAIKGYDPFIEGSPITNILKIVYADKSQLDVAVDRFSEEGAVIIKQLLQKIEMPVFSDNLYLLPDVTEAIKAREEILLAFNGVMDRHQLDALVFPQMFSEIPKMSEDKLYPSISVPQINIAGVPAITTPAGYYKSGAPFSLLFIGRLWSEADLLALAYDYEQATRHRKTPVLSINKIPNSQTKTLSDDVDAGKMTR